MAPLNAADSIAYYRHTYATKENTNHTVQIPLNQPANPQIH